MPACSGTSSRLPVRTHRPIATERTDGMRSVTTRRPEGSSAVWWVWGASAKSG